MSTPPTSGTNTATVEAKQVELKVMPFDQFFTLLNDAFTYFTTNFPNDELINKFMNVMKTTVKFNDATSQTYIELLPYYFHIYKQFYAPNKKDGLFVFRQKYVNDTFITNFSFLTDGIPMFCAGHNAYVWFMKKNIQKSPMMEVCYRTMTLCIQLSGIYHYMVNYLITALPSPTEVYENFDNWRSNYVDNLRIWHKTHLQYAPNNIMYIDDEAAADTRNAYERLGDAVRY